MGQKGSKADVGDSWTKPHGQHRWTDVDLRKLKALVKGGKLAPCYRPYEGDDWVNKELEECPICFLAYPALNWTKCCSKQICTECFLQVKWPNGNRTSVPCPFCKCQFSVIFKGPRTAAERQAVREEELRILTATQRARFRADEASKQKGSRSKRGSEAGQTNDGSMDVSRPRAGLERAATESALGSDAMFGPSRAPCRRRRNSSSEDEIMQAILLSLQLCDQLDASTSAPNTPEQEQAMLQQAMSLSLAEQQPQDGEAASPTRSVQPQAVAFSPMASRSLSTPAPREPSFGLQESRPVRRELDLAEGLQEPVTSRIKHPPQLRSLDSPCIAEQPSWLGGAPGGGMALMPVETHGNAISTPRVRQNSRAVSKLRGQHNGLAVLALGLEKDAEELEARAQQYKLQSLSTAGLKAASAPDTAAPGDQALKEFENSASSSSMHNATNKGEAEQGTGMVEPRLTSCDFVERGCGPLEAYQIEGHRLTSQHPLAGVPCGTGPLERSLSQLALPERAIRLPDLPIRQRQVSADGVRTGRMTSPEGAAAIKSSPNSPPFTSARGFDDSAEASSYCSSPQFVYSSVDSSLDRRSSSAGSSSELCNSEGLIPAVWATARSHQLTPSSSARLPRYQPHLVPLLNKAEELVASRRSPDDDAWMEFKHSLLGSDWRQTLQITASNSFSEAGSEQDGGKEQIPFGSQAKPSPDQVSAYSLSDSLEDMVQENDRGACQELLAANSNASSAYETDLIAAYPGSHAEGLAGARCRSGSHKSHPQLAGIGVGPERKAFSFAELVQRKGVISRVSDRHTKGLQTMPAPAALLVQNPDGSESVALSDRSHSEEECSNTVSPNLERTYEAASSPEDKALQQRIAQEDADMKRATERNDAAFSQKLQTQNENESEDTFDSRLKQADEQFAAKLKQRDEESHIASPVM